MLSRHALARRAALRVLTVTRIRRRRNGHGALAKFAVVTLTVLFSMSLGGGAEAFDKYQTYTRDLPDTNSLRVRELAQSTKIYDRNGVLLYVKHTSEGIRTVVPLSAISPHLVQATVSLEDRTFYTHHGIDFRRVIGAALADITHVRAAQGGSTITQQLVKATLLTNERSVERKIKEAVLALDIERRYTKTEILTLYLNEIYYGHEAYGAEAAAQTYFAKSAKDLDIAEAALLAGIPNAPSDFDPFDPQTGDAARNRQLIVLRAMLRDHHITAQEYDAAVSEKLVYKNGTLQENVTAPWFVDYILQTLDRQYGPEVVRAGGLQVTTTLDSGLQKIAEAAVASNVNRPDLRAKNVNNGAAEVIDPATGQVLAMVGSANYYDRGIGGEFNVITSRPGRQPGSSFKIYVYSTAFSNGLGPANVSNDEEGKINGQPFVDWDHKSEGIITLRQADRADDGPHFLEPDAGARSRAGDWRQRGHPPGTFQRVRRAGQWRGASRPDGDPEGHRQQRQHPDRVEADPRSPSPQSAGGLAGERRAEASGRAAPHHPPVFRQDRHHRELARLLVHRLQPGDRDRHLDGPHLRRRLPARRELRPVHSGGGGLGRLRSRPDLPRHLQCL